MDSGGMEKKEATILGLSEVLLKDVADLQARLNCRFNRSPQNDTGTVRETVPNVLDEIIANLQEGTRRLEESMGFISIQVLPKIN